MLVLYGIQLLLGVSVSRYMSRVYDGELADHLSAMGAVHVVGPKWCGKTTTARQQASSVIEMQDPDRREGYLETAKIQPSALLAGDKPRLIDEWQVAPQLWDAVRVSVDRIGAPGQYILTGSNAVNSSKIMHSGTGRIASIRMYPMSLYESRESNGTVSLGHLLEHAKERVRCSEKQIDFDDPLGEPVHSDLTVERLIYAACRGGWPAAILAHSDTVALRIARDYFQGLCEADISSVDQVSRDSLLTRAILRSYARNISTLATNKTIMGDIGANHSIAESTFYDYLRALRSLYVIQDVPAWAPAIRSKTAIRATDKKEFIDPSIAVAALGINPGYFSKDLKTFGFIFETLVVRDLRAYSTALGGNFSYYRDRYGLEADAVLHLPDGNYVLIEIKLGSHEIDSGAEHLNKLDQLVRQYNEGRTANHIPEPLIKMIVTGGEYGYRRPDDVLVIPIGCLAP